MLAGITAEPGGPEEVPGGIVGMAVPSGIIAAATTQLCGWSAHIPGRHCGMDHCYNAHAEARRVLHIAEGAACGCCA